MVSRIQTANISLQTQITHLCLTANIIVTMSHITHNVKTLYFYMLLQFFYICMQLFTKNSNYNKKIKRTIIILRHIAVLGYKERLRGI